jgi:hypothetical protein
MASGGSSGTQEHPEFIGFEEQVNPALQQPHALQY